MMPVLTSRGPLLCTDCRASVNGSYTEAEDGADQTWHSSLQEQDARDSSCVVFVARLHEVYIGFKAMRVLEGQAE
jgi:hypothetical protein